MNRRSTRQKVGEVRPSQLIYSYGIGAVVDLPNLSTMVMGLEDWDLGHMTEIGEERLLAAVRRHLGTQVERLYSPPSAPESAGGLGGAWDESAHVGVPVAPFPRWLRCPWCDLLAPLSSGLFELKTDAYRPDRTRYVHANCRKPGAPPTVVPARFLVACKFGHLDDFPWVSYVHRGATHCQAPLLRLRERGVSGEARDVFVHCDACKESRPMSEAFDPESRQLMPPCRGRRPHLRDFDERPCPEPMKGILLGASNSWFPITLSALSIPTASNRLAQLVEEHWTVLEKAATREVLEAFRQIGQLRAFTEYADDDLWAAVQARHSSPPGAEDEEFPDLRAPEWQAFSQADPGQNTTDFRLTRVSPPPRYEPYFARVVLVERLREVRSLLGFTRIESAGDYADAGEIPEDRRAPLSRRPPRWVPASEVRGEGIFLQFDEEAIARWCRDPRVVRRQREFWEDHCQWRGVRRITPPEAGFPGIRYALLHSFAHALMRQFALECGYTAASIRERVYSREPAAGDGRAPAECGWAGMLLYTAAPDSEGTLGGLVSLGEPETLARHLDQALEQLRLCASDPLCADYHAHREGITLHGAACHACLFAPETSCERGNRYLDRSLLVPTFGSDPHPFFEPRDSQP